MISIIYSDDNNRLTEEIRSLMQTAANTALSLELSDEVNSLSIARCDYEAELGVSMVDEDEIRSLNREFRGIDKVTDVLSFPQFESKDSLRSELESRGEGAYILLGDVIICYEQALRQAVEYGTGVTRELIYLFVHSIMHLLGYDHIEEEERLIMRKHEEGVMDIIGLSRELSEKI